MFSSLVNDITSNIPQTYLVIAAGSRVTGNGQFMDTQSDYDLIVLTSDEKQGPISYNHYNGIADIVVRTPDSLAFEYLQAANSRNGAVLDMIATGQVLYDPLDLGKCYQQTFQQIYQQGPWPITAYDLKRTHDHLTEQSVLLAAKEDNISTKAAAYWLAHEATKFHVDNAHGWHKSGKMLARHMRTQDPDKHACLTRLFTDHKAGITLPQPSEHDLQPFRPAELAYLTIAGRAFDYHDPNYIAHASRQNSYVEKEFMASKNKLIARSAKDGFRYRWTSILDNIKPLRYNSVSAEYHYTLAKAVKSLVLFNSTKEAQTQTIDHVTATVDAYPHIFKHFPEATEGNPGCFKNELVNSLLTRRGGLWPKDNIFRRKSPHGHRLHGYTAENLPGKILKTLTL